MINTKQKEGKILNVSGFSDNNYLPAETKENGIVRNLNENSKASDMFLILIL